MTDKFAIFKKKRFFGRHFFPEVLSCFDFKKDVDYRSFPEGSQFSYFLIGKTIDSLTDLAKEYDGVIKRVYI